jgi:hypothetical protein
MPCPETQAAEKMVEAHGRFPKKWRAWQNAVRAFAIPAACR